MQQLMQVCVGLRRNSVPGNDTLPVRRWKYIFHLAAAIGLEERREPGFQAVGHLLRTRYAQLPRQIAHCREGQEVRDLQFRLRQPATGQEASHEVVVGDRRSGRRLRHGACQWAVRVVAGNV